MDFKEKTLNDLKNAGYDITPGNVIDDLFTSKFLEFSQPLEQRVSDIYRKLSYEEFLNMSDEERRYFAANYFVEVNDGDNANGSIRLLFSEPIDFGVADGTVFSKDSGETYETQGQHDVTADEMSFNQFRGYYYFDINIEATESGVEYNAAENSITNCQNSKVESLTVDIFNLDQIINGSNPETPLQLWYRIQDSLSVRVMVNRSGISTILRNNFNSIKDIEPVTSGSPYILRDKVQIPDGRVFSVGNMYDIWVYSGDLTEKEIEIEYLESLDGLTGVEFGYGEITDVITSVKSVFVDGVEKSFSFIQEPGYENSTKQNSKLLVDDIALGDTLGVSYFGSNIIPQIQSFSINDNNRIPLGDILIKHFKIFRLCGKISYRGNVDQRELEIALFDYIRDYNYNPERRNTHVKQGGEDRKFFETSDIVQFLYSFGATKVKMPLELKLENINPMFDDADGDVILEDDFTLKPFEIVLPGELYVRRE